MENQKAESLVDQYVAENNIPAAVKLLYDLIIDSAEKNDFTRAESLRNKLLEVDSMALTEIIKSAEIIEEKKSNAIDKKHLQIWSGLYDRLTTEEKTIFYFASEAINIPSGKKVLEQKKPNSFLYLVDGGMLQMSCNIEDKEILVKKIEKSQFFGDDTFSSLQAYCSVTVKTETDVRARRIPKSALKEWMKKSQGLFNKVDEFIRRSGSTHELINSMKLKRRTQRRIPLNGSGKFQMFDPSGAKMGNPFKGTLLDASSGGMSFVIRMSKRETARMLVGRKINAQFNMIIENKELSIDRSGLIISVNEYDLTDYSIHVRFDEKINELKSEDQKQ